MPTGKLKCVWSGQPKGRDDHFVVPGTRMFSRPDDQFSRPKFFDEFGTVERIALKTPGNPAQKIPSLYTIVYTPAAAPPRRIPKHDDDKYPHVTALRSSLNVTMEGSARRKYSGIWKIHSCGACSATFSAMSHLRNHKLLAH